MKFANYLINGLYAAGAAALSVGVYLQFGLSWALMSAGALAIAMSLLSAGIINAANRGS